MSPRAGGRLGSRGSKTRLGYKAGKLDWIAGGLPTEGSQAKKPRAGDLAKKDAPTCTMGEKLGDVRRRVKDAAGVVKENNVVMGILRSEELQRDGGLTIEKAMLPRPSTFRPQVPPGHEPEVIHENRP